MRRLWSTLVDEESLPESLKRLYVVHYQKDKRGKKHKQLRPPTPPKSWLHQNGWKWNLFQRRAPYWKSQTVISQIGARLHYLLHLAGCRLTFRVREPMPRARCALLAHRTSTLFQLNAFKASLQTAQTALPGFSFSESDLDLGSSDQDFIWCDD